MMQTYIPCLFNIFLVVLSIQPINQFQVLLTVSEACIWPILGDYTTKTATKSPICPMHYENANEGEAVQAGLYQLLI